MILSEVAQKRQLRLKAFRFLERYGKDIRTKIENVSSKTTRYDVPVELFQKRCKRSNRALISWKAVKLNGITFEQLDAFQSGVVVDFVNNDFFDADNLTNPLFVMLQNRLGSDENVSAIISIKSEDGNPSSAVPREAFKKLTNNLCVAYKGREIYITERNYEDYAISQDIGGRGQGNDTWSGFIYVSIKGGQQDTIETHAGQQLTLFNPAREYASEDVCLDIDLVMSYYALMSIDDEALKANDIEAWKTYKLLLKNMDRMLAGIKYDSDSYSGTLSDFVKHHYSVSMVPGHLTDPIQVRDITIDKFNNKDRAEDSIDVAHEEAAVFERYYWDNEKENLLSAARPTNLFWAYHLSNMLQQNYSLDEYFEYEEQRFKRRQDMIRKAED